MAREMLRACAPMGAAWKAHLPDAVRNISPVSFAFVPDVKRTNLTMAEDARALRDRIDLMFGWEAACGPDETLLRRAACQIVLLLHDKHCDDGNNELLQTKLFCLAMSDRYRSHADRLFAMTTARGHGAIRLHRRPWSGFSCRCASPTRTSCS